MIIMSVDHILRSNRCSNPNVINNKRTGGPFPSEFFFDNGVRVRVVPTTTLSICRGGWIVTYASIHWALHVKSEGELDVPRDRLTSRPSPALFPTATRTRGVILSAAKRPGGKELIAFAVQRKYQN